MLPETLNQLRADFDARSKGSLALPMAGAIVWAVIAVLGMILPQRTAILALVFATGAIFPLAIVIARARGEELLGNTNPLARLMAAAVLMVNLLWALHIPLFLIVPQFIPLSIGIGLGLHWVIYGWIIAHPLGVQHAIGRSLGLVAVWFALPDYRVTACAVVVIAAYLVTLVQMRARLLAANTGSAKSLQGTV